MRVANNVNIRVFCKEEENEEEVLGGLRKIAGFTNEELKKEKLEIKKTKAKGFEDKITIFEFYVEKNKHIQKILNNLTNKIMKEDKERLKTQENRLDENLDFFIRLSKPLILKDSFELTDSGDCYHIKINIASFPKNKETAQQKIEEMFI